MLAVVAVVLGAGLGPARATSSAPEGAAVTAPVVAPEDWAEPDESLDSDPVELVEEHLAATPDPAAPLRVLALQETVEGAHVEVVEVSDAAEAAEAVAELQDSPGAVAVAVDGVRTIGSVAPGAPSRDERRPQQWAMLALDAELAWLGSRGAGTVVAVVDTGVDATHPDLTGRVLAGHDTVRDDPLPVRDGRTDPQGHGTHVAGIVAAVADNGIGVAGLAPQAKVLPVRVLDRWGSGYDSEIAEGIIWAADHGADVVNLSLSGPQPSSVLAASVAYAQAQGALVVAAAGNDRLQGNLVQYPAAYPGVVGVGALGTATTAASYSSTGGYVDVAAPGSGIVSTLPRGGYGNLDGSSMAAPYVSAAAALLHASSGGTLAAADLARALEQGAQDLGPAGRDVVTGSGRVRPVETMCLLALWCAPDLTAVQPRLSVTPDSSSVVSGGSVTVVVRAVDAGSATPVPGLAVVLDIRRTGAAATRQVVLTGADGTARVRTVVPRATSFAAVSAGTRFYSAGPNAATSVAASPTAVVTAAGTAATVRVSPALGQKVVLRQWSKGYLVVATATVSPAGTASFRGLKPGFYVAEVPAGAGLAPVATRPWRVS